jgi:hypothetical protein
MKKLPIILSVFFVIACNNSKKESAEKTESNTGTENVANPGPATDNPPASDYVPVTNITYMADGAEIKNAASVLVTKDKDNLKAGAPFVCMLTSNAAKNNNEYLTLNFLLDTKPGTYPVVGSSFQRGNSPNDEMYGGILGGKSKLTGYKVTLTECKDLGSNNMGGHKWSISGTCEEVVIPAMGIMLMDKGKKHPKEIKLQKISFTNLSFDDNWEEMMNKAMDQMKKKN